MKSGIRRAQCKTCMSLRQKLYALCKLLAINECSIIDCEEFKQAMEAIAKYDAAQKPMQSV